MLNPFRKNYNEADLEIFNFLSQVSFFERLRNHELQRFLPAINYRKYHKDEVVFFSNDPSGALYIVQQGTVHLTIDIKEDFERILEVNKGGCFGENALLANTKRLYTSIVASDAAEMMVIPGYAIHEIFDTNPQIMAKMMTSLSEYYNNNNQKLFKSYKASFGFFNLAQMFE
jgi:CRP/FNR family transcriptional regulator, cyclic AMP receptor protein